MSYTALYRKFRPARFSDVKGQDHIVRTLRNQISAGRIGHAYLFCGTRGTGKTTVAKIFAKAVNCAGPSEGEPCGECDMCRAVGSGASMNVIEIDAASNNGVDNIREIRDEVAYRPAEGRYKVYIIDEAHMLTQGAFNALLKTLEEPPEYVIFILATTEVHKIPVTVLSRCQRYDFKRISIDTIAERLAELTGKEGVEAEEKALRYIARTADGSMRDALSLLDQCIAFYPGKKLIYDDVLDVLGAVDTRVLGDLLAQARDGDARKALHTLDDLMSQGRDVGQMSDDLTWYLRNMLLAKSSDNIEDVLDISTENLARLQEEAAKFDDATLMRYIRIFSDLSNRLRYASQKRVLFEVALIKLCRPETETDRDSLLERVRVLEEKAERGALAVGSADDAAPAPDAQAGAKDAGNDSTPEPLPLPKAIPEDLEEVVRNFRNITNQAPDVLKAYLRLARLSVGERGQLLLVYDEEVHADFMGEESHMLELADLIQKKIGKSVEIEVRYVDEGRRFEDSFADIEKIIKDKIHMPVTEG